MNHLNTILLALLAGLSLTGCNGTDAQKNAAPAERSAEEEHEDADSEGPGIARIAPQAAAAAGIKVSDAGPATLLESLPLYGVVAPDAQRVRNVSARYAGVVKSVRKALGDTVAAGETLATVESNESLQTYPLQAPIAGVITDRNINVGETVTDQSLFRITDLSRVWVELSVFPQDLARIRTGQQVRVRSIDRALTGTGQVTWISPVGATATQSLTARVALDNPERRWTPGLYVAGDVVIGESRAEVAVHTAALQSMDGKTVVFVAVPEGFAPREVTTGRRDAQSVEIVNGLSAQERYVSANSFIVKADLEKAGASHDH